MSAARSSGVPLLDECRTRRPVLRSLRLLAKSIALHDEASRTCVRLVILEGTWQLPRASCPALFLEGACGRRSPSAGFYRKPAVRVHSMLLMRPLPDGYSRSSPRSEERGAVPPAPSELTRCEHWQSEIAVACRRHKVAPGRKLTRPHRKKVFKWQLRCSVRFHSKRCPNLRQGGHSGLR